MNFLAVIISVCVGVLIIISVIFGPEIYEHFSTRYESAQSNVMKENLQTKRGTAQYRRMLELEKTRTKDAEHKTALQMQIEILDAEHSI